MTASQAKLRTTGGYADGYVVLSSRPPVPGATDQRLVYYPAGETAPTHRGLLGDRSQSVFADTKARRRVVLSVYEICTFQALCERLCCKEIWVVGADKRREPGEDLPHDFEAHRAAHYAALRVWKRGWRAGHALIAGVFVGAVVVADPMNVEFSRAR